MLPSSLMSVLAAVADPVVAKVLTRGGARTGKPSGEVTAVRTMTLDGFDEIAAVWSTTLKALDYHQFTRSFLPFAPPRYLRTCASSPIPRWKYSASLRTRGPADRDRPRRSIQKN